MQENRGGSLGNPQGSEGSIRIRKRRIVCYIIDKDRFDCARGRPSANNSILQDFSGQLAISGSFQDRFNIFLEV